MAETDNKTNATDQPGLILLPGLDGTGILFRPLLAALPAGIQPQVICYPPNQLLSLAEHAELVASQLPRKEVVILAESFSGLIALSLLARREQRIKRVLFVTSFAEPPRPLLMGLAPLVRWSGPAIRLMPSRLLRFFCLGMEAGVEQLALLREALAAVPPKVLAHRLVLISSAHPMPKAKFATPCSYLQAKQDRLVPSGSAQWFRRRFERCEIEAVDAPHFLLQARPQVCADWVVRNLCYAV